jgi:predicted metalloendopeptidase
MSPDTKALALAKLKTLYFGIGHPDRWPDDDDPSVRTDDALGNLQRVAQRNHRRAVARLGRHTEPTVWCLPAQSPGAVLTFHRNAANFAAALLQVPKFDPAQSEAANYGAIGAIVGHEASHFIDTLGADYEADGTMRRWWTAQDLSGYQASTQALVDQYAAYRPFPDLGVNGNATLTENLADLGGLAAAFEAYRRAQGDRPGDPLAVRQRDRDFFIGFARAWRAKTSDDGLRAQLQADNHAPERYRIATVRNLDAWYEAFDVQPGQRLYLEPKARLRIW